MKDNPKFSEISFWDQTVRSHSANNRTVPKIMASFIIVLSLTYIFYTLNFIFSPHSSCDQDLPKPHEQLKSSSPITQLAKSPSGSAQTHNTQVKTSLHHIVFGIAASAKLWDQRKSYIKQWWRPNEMRGIVWLDKPVSNDTDEDNSLPPLKISSNTSRFKYKYPKGHRSAIRISRIVSETVRQGMEDVKWFVMGDDDTVFVVDNLVKVLAKYDHNQFYYIGSSSESHLQNINFSYNMAYGGGGFAISYPLAKALEKMQDRCIKRYPGLYGSDDRIQACMAELGVPLTKEPGFHQFDVYGNLFGLLSAHPVAPLVSLHHLDVVEPIFPNVDRVQALKRLKVPMKLDSAGLMQQSICYDETRFWTISVSWGYAVQIFRGIFSPREMEMPSRTFINWYRRSDYTGYAFNTRPVSKNTCQKPFVYYLSNALYNAHTNQTVSEYVQHRVPDPECKWKMADPSQIDRVEVYKRPDPYLWDKSPRRNCCRMLPTKKKGTMVIDVGVCGEGEVVELPRQRKT
ncbi:hypothetical protein L1049_013709 [Liquidambar formosana]|uniref:Uncharacterized protein n=1 Tax=Liquidambar formosana TaxID=63359 RepID=A0AAP0RP62_LIQFO